MVPCAGYDCACAAASYNSWAAGCIRPNFYPATVDVKLKPLWASTLQKNLLYASGSVPVDPCGYCSGCQARKRAVWKRNAGGRGGNKFQRAVNVPACGLPDRRIDEGAVKAAGAGVRDVGARGFIHFPVANEAGGVVLCGGGICKDRHCEERQRRGNPVFCLWPWIASPGTRPGSQ